MCITIHGGLMSRKKHHSSGFTLIELSIVLAIIALIAGGIVVARSMMRSAEIRSISTEMQGYITAMSQFQDKYYALPGDYAGASALWSSTTNGNGNGRITDQTISTTTVGNELREQFRAWQHLSLAGMVEGNFTGTSSDGETNQMRSAGVNVPRSEALGAGWAVVTIRIDSGGVLDMPYITGDVPPNTVLWFGGNSVAAFSTRNYMQPVLTAEEAYRIDLKLDDGEPRTGKVVGQINATGTSCFNGAGTNYNVSQTQPVCALVFKTGF